MAEKKIIAQFEEEKATKNTIKFNEIPEEGMPNYVGILYVQKYTLQRLGYKKGDILKIEISVGGN